MFGFRSSLAAVSLSAILAAPAFGQTRSAGAHEQPQNTSELAADGGFEQATSSGLNAPGWTGSSNFPGSTLVKVNDPGNAHTGSNYAVFGGSSNADQSLRQTVSIPGGATAASLSFWLGVVTQELTLQDLDELRVEIWSSGGSVLATQVTFDNTDSIHTNNTPGVYFRVPGLDLHSYSGQTIQIVFHSVNNGSRPTTFFVDDVSLQVTTSGGGTGCAADANTLCLNNGRFAVTAQWTDFQGNTGPGNVVPFGSPDSGLMWFFNPDNWEMLVKVLNGCTVNNHYWVLAALTTNVQYTIQVTDTQTGETRSYSNALGNPAPAITDTSAFASCP